SVLRVLPKNLRDAERLLAERRWVRVDDRGRQLEQHAGFHVFGMLLIQRPDCSTGKQQRRGYAVRDRLRNSAPTTGRPLISSAANVGVDISFRVPALDRLSAFWLGRDRGSIRGARHMLIVFRTHACIGG